MSNEPISRRGQGTSATAASEYVGSGKFATDLGIVLAAVRRTPMRASSYIAQENAIAYSVVWRRLSDLWRKGYVDKVVGRNHKGRKTLLWSPIPKDDPRYQVERQADVCPHCHQVIA